MKKDMKTIETSTVKEIAEYLDYLYDLALERSCHKTDTSDDYHAYEVWKNFYDVIFSENISKKIYKKYPNFEYYDPDTSYYEDVTAFINGFKEYAEKYESDNSYPTFEEYYGN